MINLEYYSEKIEQLIKKETGELGCAIQLIRTNRKECDGDSCEECEVDNLIWLAEEYEEPPIKLKRWEYDLLFSYNLGSRFEASGIFTRMKRKGYFENIKDTSMIIGDILEECEIIED